MKNILVFDTETTGFPKKGAPLEAQPHLTELAMVLLDENFKMRWVWSNLVYTEAEIPFELQEKIGITPELLEQYGIPLVKAADEFEVFLQEANVIAGHNVNFDKQIMTIALERAHCDQPNFPASFCTMKNTAPLYGKWPKLGEAYEYFTGRKLEGAHSAMVDVLATIEVLKGLASRGLLRWSAQRVPA